MRRLLIAIVATASLLAAAAPTSPSARAAVRPAVGVGEQDSSVFTSPWFTQLGITRVHYLVGWDVLRVRWQRELLDGFLASAQAVGAKPLVAFGVSSVPRRRHMAPSPRTYRKAFAAFHKRHPEVTDFVIWNEANHCSQPVCHRPQRVAAYYEAARKVCRKCKLVAADVLDSDSMRSWVTRFQAAVRHPPKVWGLHNYVDANRGQTRQTRWLLGHVRGAVWFTETGGLVRRRTTSPITFPQGLRHATRVTRFVLRRLARLSPRIQRVYLYHFVNHGPKQSWDSGVLDPHGRPRPAYFVLERWLRRAGRLPAQRKP